MAISVGTVAVTRKQAAGVLSVRIAWTADASGDAAISLPLDGMFAGAIIEQGSPNPDGSYGYTLKHAASGVDILTALTNAAGFLTLNGGGADSVVAIGAANMGLSGVYDMALTGQGTAAAQGAITLFLS